MSGHGSSGGGGGPTPDRWTHGKHVHTRTGNGSVTETWHESGSGGSHGDKNNELGNGCVNGLAWVGGTVLVVGLLGAAVTGGYFARPVNSSTVENVQGGGETRRNNEQGSGGAPEDDDNVEATEEATEAEVSVSGMRARVSLEGLDPGEEVQVIVVSEGSSVEVCPEGVCGPLNQFAREVRARTLDERMVMLTRPNRQPRLTPEQARAENSYQNVESMPLGGAIITLRADGEGMLTIPSTVTITTGEADPEIVNVNDGAAVRIMVPLEVRMEGDQSVTTTIPYSIMFGPTYPQGSTLRISRDGTIRVEQ